MKKILVNGLFLAVFILGVNSISYSAQVSIPGLVDSFQKATDLQRSQILNDNIGKEVTAAGKVDNAGEYDFFDTANDFKGTYYQVTTDQQKTANNIIYQAIFLFKDKDKVKDIDKGQDIQKDGKIIRILDERLQITIWILCADLTESDKALLKQN